jgi:hypothetical protein
VDLLSRFGKTKSLKAFLAASFVSGAAIFLSAAASQAAESPLLSNLMSCYSKLKPFTSAGEHSVVYPADQNYIFLPGSYSDHEGVFVYSDQGASFVAISDAFARKPVAFDVSSTHGASSVVYQPAMGKQKSQVWLRGANSKRNTGVSVLFKMADDSERRAPLESELESMIKGMSSTWDDREDQLVQAVEDGKYLWVEVDLDHYKDASNYCLKVLDNFPETASLRGSLRNELDDLNARASRNGVVHQDEAAPSAFMSTPQY